MSASNDGLDTIPEAETAEGDGAQTREPAVLGLVMLHSHHEPELCGAWFPANPVGATQVRVLGRGSGDADDKRPRLLGFRQRPGENAPVEPFRSPTLSKAQLLVQNVNAQTLSLKNVGRLRLLVNGDAVDEARVVPGDVVELGSQLAFLCDLRPRRLRSATGSYQHDFGAPDAHGFVGESRAAWQLRAEIAFAARHGGHVLVLGASGTGKELVAQALHVLSQRPGVLIARNAATLPEALVDAELFGNLKNYPNPGMAERKGLIGAADGGTLFLDEFADLPSDAQAHVLRVLDNGEYHRLGEDRPRRSSFRLVAATNRPEAALRLDLAARFDLKLRTPGLADRREDIPSIARHVLRAACGKDASLLARAFTPDGALNCDAVFVRHLVQHDYPANVRELRQLLWQALSASDSGALAWPLTEAAEAASESAFPTERLALQRALDENNGSLERTWRALGLSSRHALSRLLRKHAISITKKPS